MSFAKNLVSFAKNVAGFVNRDWLKYEHAFEKIAEIGNPLGSGERRRELHPDWPSPQFAISDNARK